MALTQGEKHWIDDIQNRLQLLQARVDAMEAGKASEKPKYVGVTGYEPTPTKISPTADTGLTELDTTLDLSRGMTTGANL